MTRRHDIDRMVEAVLAGKPLPSGRLDPDEVEVLRAAIELRAARAGAGVAEEEFVTGLRYRLQADATPSPPVASSPRLPRRAVLAGAAGVVAAGVVGAVVESSLASGSASRPAIATGELRPDRGQWVPVAVAGDMVGGQVNRFATATTVGFVTEHHGTLVAVSGACTHQGCLLQLDQDAGQLDCPCHRTAFGVDGHLLYSQLDTPPASLPQIQVRSRDGQIEAFLPS